MPISGVGFRFIHEVDTRATHPDLANPQSCSARYYPTGTCCRSLAKRGILVEQNKVVRGQNGGHGEIGCEICGNGVNQAFHKTERERYIPLERCKACFGSRTKTVANHRNRADDPRSLRKIPDQMLNIEVQRPSIRVRQIGGKGAYILQKIMHMRLRQSGRDAPGRAL